MKNENKKMIKKRKKPSFLRKDTFKLLRLGKKKKRVWRRARGRHNKIREKRRGYGKQPSIGWSSPKTIKNLVAGSIPKIVYNINDLDFLKENEIAIIGSKVGTRKKITIAKKALASNIKILNLNAKAFLEKIEKIKGKRKAEKEEKKKEETKKKEVKEEKEAKKKEETKKKEVKEEKEKKEKIRKEEEEKEKKEKILKKEIKPFEKTKEKMPKITQAQEIKRKALKK